MSIFEKDWKEWIDSFDLLKRLTRSIHSEKTSHSQKKNIFFVCFWQFFPWQKSEDWQDQFALVDLWKRSTRSEGILSIDREGIDNRSDSIFFMITLIFWSQKTSDSMEKPIIKIPTLPSPGLAPMQMTHLLSQLPPPDLDSPWVTRLLSQQFSSRQIAHKFSL